MGIEIEAKLRLSEMRRLDLVDLLERGDYPDILTPVVYYEYNTYYDSRRKKMLKGGKSLRIRRRYNENLDEYTSVLTFKGPLLKGKYKTRPESEVQMSGTDGRTVHDIFLELGCTPSIVFEKVRWEFNGTLSDPWKIEIDTLPGIGSFVEVEAESERTIEGIIRRFGLGDLPNVKASYVKLLTKGADKKKKQFLFNGDELADPEHPAFRP